MVGWTYDCVCCGAICGIFSQGCMLICVVFDLFLSGGVKLSLPVIGTGVII